MYDFVFIMLRFLVLRQTEKETKSIVEQISTGITKLKKNNDYNTNFSPFKYKCKLIARAYISFRLFQFSVCLNDERNFRLFQTKGILNKKKLQEFNKKKS